MKILLFNDGSLFDIEDEYGTSICELFPTIYQVEYGNNKYELGEDNNDLMKDYGNATMVTIRLLAFKDDIKVEKMDF